LVGSTLSIRAKVHSAARNVPNSRQSAAPLAGQSVKTTQRGDSRLRRRQAGDGPQAPFARRRRGVGGAGCGAPRRHPGSGCGAGRMPCRRADLFAPGTPLDRPSLCRLARRGNEKECRWRLEIVSKPLDRGTEIRLPWGVSWLGMLIVQLRPSVECLHQT